ncbi:MAG: phosphatidylglycerophosphatase A [Micavibrio sp.]|nr:phosphatidylglycerophosphatase A [Micavibrio sp.]
MAFIDKLKPRIKPVPEGFTMADWPVWLSTWFGAGRLRPAPGTIGTAAAVPVGYAITYFGGWVALALAALSMLCIGIVAADRYGKKSGEPDDQSIVIDEVVGVWIAAIPAEKNLVCWGIAFLLFRIFDIYKPWPASYYDRKKRGGIDVMMDDVVAGIYAFCGVAVAGLYYMPN